MVDKKKIKQGKDQQHGEQQNVQEALSIKLLETIDLLPPEKKGMLNKIHRPMEEFAETIYRIHAADIDFGAIPHCLELLKSIVEKEFDGFVWLAAVKKIEAPVDPIDAIRQILLIFENLIDVNQLEEITPPNVNRIISQLTNVVQLSKALNDAGIRHFKYQLNLLQSQYLNSDHIGSRGYSQEGEDLILDRLFQNMDDGFFVDVGAHHPTRFSNTYLFYKKGWRGINIDPLPGSMEKFNLIRPDDINLELAITDDRSAGKSIKYIQFAEPAYNCIIIGDSEDHQELIGDKEVMDIVDVETRRLDSVLEEHTRSIDRINLLNIDVESSEMLVLKSFDIKKYKPEVIVVEGKGFSIENRDADEVYAFLTQNGYTLRSVLFHSLIFKHSAQVR